MKNSKAIAGPKLGLSIPKSEFKSKRIKTNSECPSYFFAPGSELETVSCPEAEMKKFANETWVFCPTRNEPVRLFAREYSII